MEFYFEEVKKEILEKIDLDSILERWKLDLSAVNEDHPTFSKIRKLFRGIIKIEGVDNFVRKLRNQFMEFSKKLYACLLDYTWS